jgi:hypothetical protein
MSNALRILAILDQQLNAPVDLTLYGRAALQLGFVAPPAEYALSKDLDAILWLGQAEELAQRTNFWEAVESTNQLLGEDGLYVSHLFEENQVVLSPDWREHRVSIPGRWEHLLLSRLGDQDLLLTKLMRDEPLDQMDARFIVGRSGLKRADVERAVAAARIPDLPELREEFLRATRKLQSSLSS